jgi:hypothetical protein
MKTAPHCFQPLCSHSSLCSPGCWTDLDALYDSINQKAPARQTVDLPVIAGITAPLFDEEPATVIAETAQYTGTVSWSPAHSRFQKTTTYTATISLKPKSGFSLNDLPGNFFRIEGAETVHEAGSGTITAVFPATRNGYAVVYYANGASRGTVPADNNDYNANENATVKENSGTLIGPEIGGPHAGSGICQRFTGWHTDPAASTAMYTGNETIAMTANLKLHAMYTRDESVLRKVGPAGGWVFYDAGSRQSWGRYLEAWNHDETVTFIWQNPNPSYYNFPGTSQAIGSDVPTRCIWPTDHRCTMPHTRQTMPSMPDSPTGPCQAVMSCAKCAGFCTAGEESQRQWHREQS